MQGSELSKSEILKEVAGFLRDQVELSPFGLERKEPLPQKSSLTQAASGRVAASGSKICVFVVESTNLPLEEKALLKKIAQSIGLDFEKEVRLYDGPVDLASLENASSVIFFGRGFLSKAKFPTARTKTPAEIIKDPQEKKRLWSQIKSWKI